MKRNHSIVILLLLSNIIAFYSCKSNNDKQESIPLFGTNIIEIDLEKNDSTNSPIDSLIEIKGIIPLETPTNIFLSNITKCIVRDSLIYVFDQTFSRLIVYSNTGKFIRNIGKLGNKTGEYENIADFYLDSLHRIIIYSSESMKLLTYNQEGTCMSEKKVPFYGIDISFINSNLYAFYTDYNTSNYNSSCNLILADSLQNVQKVFFKYPSKPDGVSLRPISGGLFQKNSSTVIYYGAFQDSVFQLTSKGIPVLRYVFNFGGKSVPREVKYSPSSRFTEFMEKMLDMSYLTGPIYETDSLISFSVFENRSFQKAIFYKSKNILFKDEESKSCYTKYLGNTVGVTGNNFISSISSKYFSTSVLNKPSITKYLQKRYPNLFETLNTMHNHDSNPTLVIWGQRK